MNYPQIMSPVPFACKSGGHVPQLLWERCPWLLRPETLDRRRLTVWTAESADGSIQQSGVLVNQARRWHALANYVAWCVSMQGFVRQNSHLVQYPFWGPQPVKTDKCVGDVVASFTYLLY